MFSQILYLVEPHIAKQDTQTDIDVIRPISMKN